MIDKADSISDNILVARIKDDNTDAYRALYDRYSRKIYCFSLQYLSCKEDCKELVQSVFMNIWEHRQNLDPTLSVKNYIYRCAVNYITNHLKKKSLHTRFVKSEMTKNEFQADLTYEQVCFHDLETSINSIIGSLPSQQQKIFQLSRYYGLSHEEIADKLDLSVRTVENQMYRALKVLRSVLKEEHF